MIDKRRKQRIARENGRKSKGPVTPHGKLMSSLNSLKHGLSSASPLTILVSDDAEEYQRIVEGLTLRYAPTSPLEKHLIQVAAQAMIRQQRLWRVDSALANIDIIKAEQRSLYPDTVIPGKTPTPHPLAQYEDKREPWQEAQIRKMFAISDGWMALKEAIAHPPETPDGVWNREDAADNTTWLQVIDRAVDKTNWSDFLDESWGAAVETLQCLIGVWVYYWDDVEDCEEHGQDPASIDPGPPPLVDAVLDAAQKVLKELQAQKTELERAIAQCREIDRAIEDVVLKSKAITAQIDFNRAERLDRYQKCISRDLYHAIDRLESMRRDRFGNENSGGAVGSFGHLGILEGGNDK